MVRAGMVLGGRYRLEQRIGSGGMGEVWRALDRVLGRTVAVKCLLAAPLDDPGYADDTSFVDRFWDEARTMATISHPGVVEVYDFGDDPTAGMYLVMKYVEGESLAHALVRAGRLSAEATMRLVAEAAEALHAAHELGVTHRDVKPGNLLLGPDGRVLLTDFGIARSAGETGHTTTGSLVGTAGYIAPERANGHPATAQSDIYSLGVVAYRCLAGRLPFAGDSVVEIALRHVNDAPPPLPVDVPPQVRAVVERAMAKDPAVRWPSAAVLADQARSALIPELTRRESSQPSPDLEAMRAPTQRQAAQPDSGRRGARRLLVSAVAVVVIAITATVSVILSRRSDPQPQGLRENPAASAAATPDENVVATQVVASPGATTAVPSAGPTPSATRPRVGTGNAPPAPPKSLTATPISASTIRLRWSDDSADEDGFTVTNGATSSDVGANKTAYDWSGLAPATRSCFKVRAYNSSGASAYHPSASGDWVCATTLSGSGPAAPTGLTARAISTSTIRLLWTDMSSNEDGFTVINGNESRNAAANATAFNWDGLAPGTYMCFKIRAYNASGVSAYHPTAEHEWVCLTTPTT